MISREKICKIYDHIQDDKSKKIFRHRVLYTLFSEKQDEIEVVKTTEEAVELAELLNGIDGYFVLFGGGKGAEWCIDLLGDIAWKCIIDNAPKQKFVRGIPLLSYKEYKWDDNDIVVISSFKYAEEMEAQLLQDGFPMERIVNAGRLLTNLMKRTYFDLPDLKREKREVFVDVGSFDGMTSVYFDQWNRGKGSKIYVLEPDKENLKACKDNLKTTNLEYKIIPQGAWSSKTTLRFEASNSVGSRVSEKGNELVEVTDLDSILMDEKVTFIKMDIEGAEKEALIGAQKIIQKFHPKLAISIYHKKEDIFELPQLILSYDESYRFYIRHYSFCDADTVLYAI